jgi:branched-chain amino acid transport system permease protein
MSALSLWLSRTRGGKALRATAEDITTAGLLGIDTDRMIAATVVIASAMGGVAGVLVGMAFNYINNQIGLSMGLKGLAIIIFGGMGSVYGAMAGGLILGLSETFVVAYGSSGYRDAIAFVIIIAVLLVRPQGLFGPSSPGGRR